MGHAIHGMTIITGFAQSLILKTFWTARIQLHNCSRTSQKPASQPCQDSPTPVPIMSFSWLRSDLSLSLSPLSVSPPWVKPPRHHILSLALSVCIQISVCPALYTHTHTQTDTQTQTQTQTQTHTHTHTHKDTHTHTHSLTHTHTHAHTHTHSHTHTQRPAPPFSCLHISASTGTLDLCGALCGSAFQPPSYMRPSGQMYLPWQALTMSTPGTRTVQNLCILATVSVLQVFEVFAIVQHQTCR